MQCTIVFLMSLCPTPIKKVCKNILLGLEIVLLRCYSAPILFQTFTSSFVAFIKAPVSRSISTGSGMSTTTKDQNMDMNGPLVPEKVLKSIQVCVIYFTNTFRVVMLLVSNRSQVKVKSAYDPSNS